MKEESIYVCETSQLLQIIVFLIKFAYRYRAYNQNLIVCIFMHFIIISRNLVRFLD